MKTANQEEYKCFFPSDESVSLEEKSSEERLLSENRNLLVIRAMPWPVHQTVSRGESQR